MVNILKRRGEGRGQVKSHVERARREFQKDANYSFKLELNWDLM